MSPRLVFAMVWAWVTRRLARQAWEHDAEAWARDVETASRRWREP